MGFRPQPTVYNLSFQDTALDGLHVKIGCCTVGEHNRMTGLVGQTPISTDPEKALADLAAKLEEVTQHNEWVLNLFAGYLISWDMEDAEGNPVPANREGVDSLERAMVSMIIAAWQRAMVTIPNPSKSESISGETSEEESLGLGSLSQSP